MGYQTQLEIRNENCKDAHEPLSVISNVEFKFTTEIIKRPNKVGDFGSIIGINSK